MRTEDGWTFGPQRKWSREAQRLCRVLNERNGTALDLLAPEDAEVAVSPSGQRWFSVTEAGAYGATVAWVTEDPFFHARIELILPDSDTDA
jgi:hypothetical protein